MFIRKAKLEDMDKVIELTFLALGDYRYVITGYDDDALVKKKFEEFFVSDKGCYSYENFIVADHNEQVVGSLNYYDCYDIAEMHKYMIESVRKHAPKMTKFEIECEPEELYLDTIAVDPAYQGRGIAKKLINFAEKRGREKGFAVMSLIVLEKKEKAYWLYRRMSFREMGQKEIYGDSYKYMVKKIK